MKRFLILVVVACGSRPAPEPTEPVGNDVEGPSEPMPLPAQTGGQLWACRIDGYDPQPCQFAQVEGQWTLRKLLGSQRFYGDVSFDTQGFDFDGDFFCPWGDCATPFTLRFDLVDDHRYFGQHDGTQLDVRFDAELAAEWGGAGYGGLTGDEH